MQSCCNIYVILYDMKIVISYREKFIRKDLVRYVADRYPNSSVESYEDSMLAAKSVYEGYCDVMLMGVDGIKLIPMLRKREDDINIIILSDNELSREEAFSAGADSYITRPIDYDKLYSAIEGTLH